MKRERRIYDKEIKLFQSMKRTQKSLQNNASSQGQISREIFSIDILP